MNDVPVPSVPLKLVTKEGVDAWRSQGEPFTISYGLIGHEKTGRPLYRALFDKAGETFLLVDPDTLDIVAAPISFRGEDAVIDHLFEIAPGASPVLHLDTSGFVDGKLPTAACFMAQT
jgi:hypothetical protein